MAGIGDKDYRTGQDKSLLLTLFNSRHACCVALALSSEQQLHFFCFGAAEQEALWSSSGLSIYPA